MALFFESVNLLSSLCIAFGLFTTVTANAAQQKQESASVRISKQHFHPPYLRPFLNDRQLLLYYPSSSYWNSPYFYYYPVSNVGYVAKPSTKHTTNPLIANDDHSNSQIVDPVTGRQYFGVTNVFSTGLNKNQSCSNATCPVCDTCPKQCSAILSPAPLLYLTQLILEDCVGLRNLYRCTYLYTAVSGTFVMNFPDFLPNPEGLAVSIKIVATCPNTRITLTCPSIQQGVSISTQNTQYSLPNTKVEETSGTMVVVVKMINGSPSPSPEPTVTACNWIASP